jgi:hypothetical protein
MRQAQATRRGLRRLVEAARAAGELDPRVASAQLARTIEAVISGSLLTWAFYQKGSAERWVRTDLDAVLAPYLSR